MEKEKVNVTPPEPSTDDHAELTPVEEWEYVTGLKLLIVMAAVTVPLFLMFLDIAIVVTAIPRITSDFQSLQDVGWYGSSYLLTSATFQPLTGKIYARFGSKIVFLSCLGIFELGSLICGLANSSPMLIVGRAIAGIGTSGIMNGCLTIIAACLPITKRPVYIGVMLAVSQLGLLLGPLIGGSLTQYTTWRWCFYINLPAGGLVAIFLMFIKIPNRNAKSTVKRTITSTLLSLDLVGFVLFAPTAVMLLLALEWGGVTYPWNSATIIGLFCGSVGMLVAFLAWEYRMEDGAMVPLSMIRQRIIWSSCVESFFLSGTILTTSYFIPIYFQAVRDATPTLSGVYVLPSIISQMMAAIISGFIVSKLGYYLPVLVICGVITAIGQGLLSTFDLTTPTATWIGYQIVAGFGRGFGLQIPLIAIQNTLPDDKISVGMSVGVFFQSLGGAVFISLDQTAFNDALFHALADFAPGISVETVKKAGATGIRSAVPEAAVEGVLKAYAQAISRPLYLGTGAAVGIFIFSWGTGWKSVKRPKKPAATTP